jgi:ribonuclease J
MLSEDGLLSAIVTIDKSTLKQIGRPVIISRGFVHMKEQTALTNQITDLVEETVQARLDDAKSLNIGAIKRSLTKTLNKHIYETTERNPMIMPVVMIVESQA